MITLQVKHAMHEDFCLLCIIFSVYTKQRSKQYLARHC